MRESKTSNYGTLFIKFTMNNIPMFAQPKANEGEHKS